MKLKLRVIFFLIFCLPGLAILGYSAKLAAAAHGLTSTGLTANGTIVDHDRQTRRRVGQWYCPIVEFFHQGASYRFTDNDDCKQSRHDAPTGSRVEVVFDPAQPSRARVDSFRGLYGTSLLSAAIGLPWLLLGIALVVRVR